jgi:hypothetical protein
MSPLGFSYAVPLDTNILPMPFVYSFELIKHFPQEASLSFKLGWKSYFSNALDLCVYLHQPLSYYMETEHL